MTDTDDLAEILERRKRQQSSTPDDEMKCCPECGSKKVHKRVAGPSRREIDKDWLCKHCRANFDDPTTVGEYNA